MQFPSARFGSYSGVGSRQPTTYISRMECSRLRRLRNGASICQISSHLSLILPEVSTSFFPLRS